MFKKISTILLLVCSFALSSQAGIKDSIGVTKIGDKLHVRYMVSPGETIYGISTKYGIPVSDLLEINPELENGLKVGQVINIPYQPELKSTKTAQDENKIKHQVQQGETLYGIAKKYNTSVSELLRMNNMELKAGQEIVVGYKDKPNTAANTPSTPPSHPPVKKENINPAQQPATSTPTEEVVPYVFNPDAKQVLVIPFDPYLYFSDADAEISAKSNMPMPKVRQVFRRRINALLMKEGYETIHLLGGKSKDSTYDLNKIYSSVTYSYQEKFYNPNNPNHVARQQEEQAENKKGNLKDWAERQKDKLTGQSDSRYDVPKDHGKYFGVIIKNPTEFFAYFNKKYSVDYYIFINQFEVKTNYENCLDRAALNYERTFTTHYSVFDSTGRQIAGDKFKTHYNSNTNYVYSIVADNAPKIVERILSDIPPPDKTY